MNKPNKEWSCSCEPLDLIRILVVLTQHELRSYYREIISNRKKTNIFRKEWCVIMKNIASIEAELDKQRQKMEKLKKELAVQQRKEAEERRKLDTHNKIVLGGAVLSVLGRGYEIGDEHRLIEFLKQQNLRGNYFNDAMAVSMTIDDMNVAKNPGEAFF